MTMLPELYKIADEEIRNISSAVSQGNRYYEIGNVNRLYDSHCEFKTRADMDTLPSDNSF